LNREEGYWELRKLASLWVPRSLAVPGSRNDRRFASIKIKKHKTNLKEFSLWDGEWKDRTRLLKEDHMGSFLEISLKAHACPMPLNLDVWDGLVCPFRCIYCFANGFRTTLYGNFFDNSQSLGLRHCSPDYYLSELDKLMALRDLSPTDKRLLTGTKKAIAMEYPIRFGIRFEDFIRPEGRKGVSLRLLQYLKEMRYPVMINSKSDLLSRDDYLEALSGNRAAVHLTIISSDSDMLRKLEPGAPSYERRIETAARLNSAGVRVVARIEPFLVFMGDEKEDVRKLIDDFKSAGIRRITFDTFSYSSNMSRINELISQKMKKDFQRVFLLESDSQPLGSLLLRSFMDEFRKEGFSCSTFDPGNIFVNDQNICCEVEDWFDQANFNWGCMVGAVRFITSQSHPVGWREFEEWAEEKGGFLSPQVKREVYQLWNCEGSPYDLEFCNGIEPVGRDENGIVWKKSEFDFPQQIRRGLSYGAN
jgi:DNA repair photolyase